MSIKFQSLVEILDFILFLPLFQCPAFEKSDEFNTQQVFILIFFFTSFTFYLTIFSSIFSHLINAKNMIL